jgi:hypothetical protein
MKEDTQMPDNKTPDQTPESTNDSNIDSTTGLDTSAAEADNDEGASVETGAQTATTVPLAEPELARTEDADESTTEAASGETEPVSAAMSSSNKSRFSPAQIIVGVVVLIVFLGGLLYLLEERGVINTGVLAEIEKTQLEQTVIATVNGEEISAYELEVSIEQQAAAAEAQGIDTSDPAIIESIRSQSVDLLINTELLKGEAFERGLSVSDAEAMERYDALVAEVGGEEVLQDRMMMFGVTEEILQRDIRDELLIQQLVDQVFENNEVVVTDEEATALYEEAGGEEAGLPPFSQVEPQIRDQIIATKEQELINELIEELRAEATIEITDQV